MDGVERQGFGMPKDLPLPPPHMITGRAGVCWFHGLCFE